MTSAPSSQRRRLRFGLRAALVGTTLVAVASWLYWDGWPRYRVFREQRQFEAAVRALTKAPLHREAGTALARFHRTFGVTLSDQSRHQSGYIVYEWPNAMYFVYFPAKDSPHFKHTAMELYRLKPALAKYTAQTDSGRRLVERFEDHGDDERLNRAAYWGDFNGMISGNRSDSLGFEYELIYSAPPE